MGLLDIKPNKVKADLLDYKIAIYGQAKSGKALTNDTLIPTPGGFKRLGEIEVGDKVYDRLGKETNVVGVFPQGELEVYEVELNDGRKFYANDEHIVPYITRRGNINNKTVAEMEKDYKLPPKKKFDGNVLKGNKYNIPNSEAVEFGKKDLTIDPYALGVLIGDGALSVRYLTISSDEYDVVNKASQRLGLETPVKSEHNYNWRYMDNGGKRREVMDDIVGLGLNVTSAYKFIPEVYQQGSVEQRKELLRGLMDSDGTVVVSPKGATRFDFCTNAEQLAKDVKLLAHSLGYGATLSSVNREDKKNVEYYVSIYTSDTSIVTSKKHTQKVAEKAKSFSRKEEYAKLVSIKKLDKKEPMTCLKVDNEEELFLINDYIVTHNTTLVYDLVDKKYDGDLSKMLLLATERGYNALDGVYAQDISSWAEFKRVVKELIDNKEKYPFEILAIDTVDKLEEYATDYTIKAMSRNDKKKYVTIGDAPYGAGYAFLESEVSDTLDKLDKAGYTLWYITHDKDKTFKTEDGVEFNKTDLSLGSKVKGIITNDVDFIFYIKNESHMNASGGVDVERYIYLRDNGNLVAGSRFSDMPEKIKYSTEGLLETVEGAILSKYGGSQEKVEEAKQEQQEEAEEEATEEVISEQSASELHKEISEIIKTKEKSEIALVSEKLKEAYDTANYTKIDDVDTLLEIKELVK